MNAQDAMKEVVTSALVAGVAVLVLAAIVWGAAFLMRKMKPPLEGFVVRLSCEFRGIISATETLERELRNCLESRGAVVLMNTGPTPDREPDATITVLLQEGPPASDFFGREIPWTVVISVHNRGEGCPRKTDFKTVTPPDVQEVDWRCIAEEVAGAFTLAERETRRSLPVR